MQPPGAAPLTIKPSSQAFGKGLTYRAAIFLPLIVVGFLGQRDSALPGWAVWTVIGAGLVVALAAIAAMITRVSIAGPDIVIRRLVGTEKRIPIGAVTKTVLVQQYEQFGNSIAPTFAAVAGSSKPFLRLSGQVYDADDLLRLARALGRADIITEAVTPKLLEQRHPGLVPLFERRPWTIAWIVVGLFVVIAVAAGVAAES